MGFSTSDALHVVASCDELLGSINRLEIMINRLVDPADGLVTKLRRSTMEKWVGEARETVLDIKSIL
ncbi:hypothetical protein LCGC14_1416230 [marine sediment metagenome]|uniref:Uncharacterized protein n=1 Tax=marine sediment metagenome TaxID=412755 RepID=A0A0F9MUG2_9ZZZZ